MAIVLVNVCAILCPVARSQKPFVVRTSVRIMLRTEVRTTNLTYCGQSIGHDMKY
ncbi:MULTISPECIES: hypothetical protein [unclassified Microcoleus]|uniref:hypothetical protein n=1 Tax=unclassified Microcoleus TaxID=2642155 RepID=UPI001D735B47|nr:MULTISPECIES: hypothetical protein [unclassified Microcoleus]MCC3492067.1 hypothetical protein [Microcoleus sp. PH2017_16_JOR_D_A]MCC3581589.1 hypothetical protein [Microcoleus sp. PH2017_32_RDM_D_A]MCC3434610.1 hypothetical protein [Microcoleus sp. PH2017_05_CCC_O_A]MCC3484743.1 hypothetical protein [Microcoleus sp. PH2017_14_LAR_D_A]MCC3496162.1 hypothetical protein [Microcoleus sp. PH2017_15_JOR_U_A]